MAIKSNIDKNKDRLNTIKSSYVLKNPNMLFVDKAYNYNDLIKRLRNSINVLVDNKKNNYINLLSKLEVLNPVTTLKRGYSVTRCNDKIITKTKDIKIGDMIVTSITNGKIESEVKNVYEEN
jgi:exodeoxyribonuclease VII large subunit